MADQTPKRIEELLKVCEDLHAGLRRVVHAVGTAYEHLNHGEVTAGDLETVNSLLSPIADTVMQPEERAWYEIKSEINSAKKWGPLL